MFKVNKLWFAELNPDHNQLFEKKEREKKQKTHAQQKTAHKNFNVVPA